MVIVSEIPLLLSWLFSQTDANKYHALIEIHGSFKWYFHHEFKQLILFILIASLVHHETVVSSVSSKKRSSLLALHAHLYILCILSGSSPILFKAYEAVLI